MTGGEGKRHSKAAAGKYDRRSAERKTMPDSLRYMGAITVWLTDHASASARELAGKLELSTSQVRRYLNRLMAKGVVEKQGSGPATRNRLKRKPRQGENHGGASFQERRFVIHGKIVL